MSKLKLEKRDISWPKYKNFSLDAYTLLSRFWRQYWDMTTTTTRNKTWSWTDEVLPFVAMLLITCLDMSVLTIVKAAMNGGMNSFVYIVYHDALGTLILFPFFIIHTFRFMIFLSFILLDRVCYAWHGRTNFFRVIFDDKMKRAFLSFEILEI